ncbi:hypothetical protein NMG60_11032020 [Bertholletia excelsa]
MVAEPWIVKISNQVSANLKHSSSSKSKNQNRGETIGILSFEVANVMSKAVHLHKSLMNRSISKLRAEISSSEGVKALVSSDEDHLLSLALVEKLDDLNRIAGVVSRLGKKCAAPALQGFEHVYADLASGAIDVKSLGFLLVKDMESMVKKMERYVNSTAALYSEMEVLSELEHATKKFQQSHHEESRKAFEQKLLWQKQDVGHLKDVSLWNQKYDKVVELLARMVCSIYSRICLVFDDAILRTEFVGSSISGSFLSRGNTGQLRPALSKRSGYNHSRQVEKAMAEKMRTDFVGNSASGAEFRYECSSVALRNESRGDSGRLKPVLSKMNVYNHSGPIEMKKGAEFASNSVSNVEFSNGGCSVSLGNESRGNSERLRPSLSKTNSYNQSGPIRPQQPFCREDFNFACGNGPGRLFMECLSFSRSAVAEVDEDDGDRSSQTSAACTVTSGVNKRHLNHSGCLTRTQSGISSSVSSRFGPKSRLQFYVPPSTVGGSALALHYANIIIVIEKFLRYPHLVGEDARDDLYQMLPTSLRKSLKASLRSYVKDLAIYDAPLAHDWKEKLEKILKWLGPLAHNMIRWQSERNFEQHQIVTRTNVLLLQTIYFADREKTEEAIRELLVGLNYICRYEQQQNALLECAGSFDFDDFMAWQMQCRASYFH